MRSRVYRMVQCPSVCPLAGCSSMQRVCSCGPGRQKILINCFSSRQCHAASFCSSWTQTIVTVTTSAVREFLLQYTTSFKWLDEFCTNNHGNDDNDTSHTNIKVLNRCFRVSFNFIHFGFVHLLSDSVSVATAASSPTHRVALTAVDIWCATLSYSNTFTTASTQKK